MADRTSLESQAVVIDGDTLLIDWSQQAPEGAGVNQPSQAYELIRLEGIDAPECGQTCASSVGDNWPCGRAAIEELAKLIDGRKVSCTGSDRIAGGILKADCFVGTVNINAEMVRRGMAWAIQGSSTTNTEAEIDAKHMSRGVWQHETSPPWSYRAARWENAKRLSPNECPIKGVEAGSGAQVYYLPWTAEYEAMPVGGNNAGAVVWLCSEGQALQLGYRPALAKPVVIPRETGIIGIDDRVPANENPVWDAIGQVNVAGYNYRMAGQCTGTLVAPDIVITAATCVMGPRGAEAAKLESIRFVAGVHLSEKKNSAVAKCLHLPGQHQFINPDQFRVLSDDEMLNALSLNLVAIVLDQKLNISPVSLAEGMQFGEGTTLVHAAYPSKNKYHLAEQHNCRLLNPEVRAGLWLDDCDSDAAGSGGPLFIEVDHSPKLVAIRVATREDRIGNFSVPLSEWRDLLTNNSCP